MPIITLPSGLEAVTVLSLTGNYLRNAFAELGIDLENDPLAYIQPLTNDWILAENQIGTIQMRYTHEDPLTFIFDRIPYIHGSLLEPEETTLLPVDILQTERGSL